MTDLSRVGVVIVTHASASTIVETLTALPQDRLGGVVVVDNASPDDTVQVVRATGTRVVEQDNVGFGGGNNRGAAELATELVLFLNPDAVLRQEELERLVRHLDAHPRCALVGPRMTSRGQPTHAAGRLPTLASETRPLLPWPLSRLGPRRRTTPGEEVTGPVGYVEGACFLVRREALEDAGGFDPGYFLYFEELEMAQRLHRRGHEVHVCAEALAEHVMAASTSGIPYGGSPHLVASEIRYLRRWHGERQARLWARSARLSWALRDVVGRLDHERRLALREAAREALRHPPPPPVP